MPFAVVFQIRSRADITRIVSWISERNPRTADRWRVGLQAAVVDKLEADPRRYPAADEADDLGLDLRELLFGRKPHVYRALFTIVGNTVYVHRVRHAAQDRLDAEDF